MNQILFCLIPLLILSASAARKEKKTTIEGVERGYVTTKAELSPPPLPKIPSNSPTQFGFVPVKTAANYIKTQPKITYAQPQYVADNQGRNTYPIDISQSFGLQYASGTHYAKQPAYAEVGSSKGVTQKPLAQTQAFYVPQSAQNQYLNYENLQYVTDNNIEQGVGQQEYNPQQYYYLQQYQEPSTSIQAVVDPKGGLQYIMYIPTYVPNQTADQKQNYENVYANNEPSYQSPSSSSSDYNNYLEKLRTIDTGKSAYNFKDTESSYRREPKSLLDSYVPSSVQLQYYKQSQLNSIRDSQKYENYGPIGAESTYRYNIRQTPFRR